MPVTDRMTPVDVSYLYLEEASTVMNVGSLLIIRPADGGVDFDALPRLVADRIGTAPRFRQRLVPVPGRLANPVWVDDTGFDLDYHLRRSGLPHPGGPHELDELVARVMSRRLDRHRPLWEAYLIDGLASGEVALLTKGHQALIDGVRTVDLSQLLVDEEAVAAPERAADWRPRRRPSPVELVGEALAEWFLRPTAVVDTLRSGLADLQHNADQVGAAVNGLLHASSSANRSPLNVELGQARRYARLSLDLGTVRRVRDFFQAGGRIGPRQAQPSITVNDVILAVLAGGLREWLWARGDAPRRSTELRALVPMSIRQDQLGTRVGLEAVLVDLPVGEPSPAMRLRSINYQTRVHRQSGRAVPARALTELGGFAPATIHSLGVRLAGSLSRRVFNLVVTNVPGPQHPVYVGADPLVAPFPVIPLARGQGLSVGITSYQGLLNFGFYADRDALHDLDVLVDCVREALSEFESELPDAPPGGDDAGQADADHPTGSG